MMLYTRIVQSTNIWINVFKNMTPVHCALILTKNKNAFMLNVCKYLYYLYMRLCML